MCSPAPAAPVPSATATESVHKNKRKTGGRRKGMGKRKIEIKKIEDLNSRYVTFSKRRQGLFKKATEFCARSGVGSRIAVVVLSPGGKPFVHEDPPGSLNNLIDRVFRETGDAGEGGGMWVSEEEQFNAEESDAGELESLVNGLEEFRGIASRFEQSLGG